MAAPKYNYYALGNNGGRPPKFETPEDLDKKVSEYFQFCVDKKEELTMSGLVLYLGFSSRSSLRDYTVRNKGNQEFAHIIEKAKLSVEKSYEMELHTFKWGGGAFALRNINSEYWKEETEVEVDLTANIKADFGGNVIHTTSEPS